MIVSSCPRDEFRATTPQTRRQSPVDTNTGPVASRGGRNDMTPMVTFSPPRSLGDWRIE